MKNERIFITGGAGYLGRNIVKRYYNDNEITIYSRDEAKHYYLKKEFPNIKCVVGYYIIKLWRTQQPGVY